jgi:proline iminopeptidase
VAAGVLVVMLAGLVAGRLLPRGPVTVPAALFALTVALAVGLGAGWLARFAWILLIAPFTFMAVFELARVRVEGPTVSGIDLGGLYGIIALIGGRGIDALLMLPPLIVGCGWGVVLGRRYVRSAESGPGARHRLGLGVLAMALIWAWYY